MSWTSWRRLAIWSTLAAPIAPAVSGCSEGDVRECSVRCSDTGACPSGHVCGDDGFCIDRSRPETVCAAAPDPPSDGPEEPGPEEPPPSQVDVLFVIDDSQDMEAHQMALAAGFPSFVAALEASAGGRPDLHIGVISTNLGGNDGVPGCEGAGDGGGLHNAPGGTCPAPTDLYIVDSPAGEGRQINYPEGMIAETFTCIASLGATGCGFEHPLAAMRLALSPDHPDNVGFRRPDASLAIIFLTNEDDCSASDPALFSLDNVDILGPTTSYRCFEYGVVCEPDSRDTLGPREACRPREDSPYMVPVADYVDFLGDLAPPERLVVAGIFGPTTPVVVQTSLEGDPEVATSCTGTAGTGDPAIRLQAFIEAAAPAGGLSRSICSDDLGPILGEIAEQVAETVEL